MSETGHAPLGPSAAARWLTCPGSVPLNAALPDAPGEAALQGTRCHAALARMLGVAGPPVPLPDEEETTWVLQAVDYVKGRIAAGWHLAGVEVVVPVWMPFGQDFQNLLWGTADIILVGPKGELEVIDAKFGFEEVEVVGNPQLRLYALGVVWGEQHAPLGTPVKLTIVQPRNSVPVRSEDLTVRDLLKWADEQEPALHAAATALIEGTGPLKASEKGCRWCKAASECPELRRQVDEMAEDTFALVEKRDGFLQVTPEYLSKLLDRAEMVESAIKQVRAYALKALALGVDVPGYKRVRSNKHRQWKDPEKAKEALSLLGPEEQYLSKPELLSPAQVEKRMKVPKKTLDTLAPKPEGDPVLARADDPREALAADFTDTTTTKELHE